MWSAVAEVKNGHVLRVGLADFAGALDPLAVCVELTAIAEACLQAGARDRRGAAAARRAGALAVLALGKLGGRELGYAADLDVVFVYTGDDDAVEHFSRLAQRLLGALRQRTPRGRLYEVDTRLRPCGSQGLLVSSLAGVAALSRAGRAAVGAPGADQAAAGRRRSPRSARRSRGTPSDTVYGAPHDRAAIADAIARCARASSASSGGAARPQDRRRAA